MTALHQKLNQLSLTTMSRQLDQTIADAAARNLSLADTLESLADLELEARNSRAIERRFRFSRLQAQHSIDASTSNITRAAWSLKTAHPAPARSGVPHQGNQRCLHRQSRRGQNLPGQNHRLARLPGQPARAVHHRHGHAQSPARFAGRSLAGPQAARSTPSPRCSSCDELGYLSLDQQTSNLFYQVISTRHSQKRSTIITTNTAFSDWGNILYNTTIATAIADRLVENSEIFLLGGDSLRKANKNPNPPAE